MQTLSLSLKEEVKEEPLSDEAWDSNRWCLPSGKIDAWSILELKTSVYPVPFFGQARSRLDQD